MKYLTAQDFINTKYIFKLLSSKSEEYWNEGLEQKALECYKLAKTVHAYNDFLKKNNIEMDSIKSINDYIKLPIMSKSNYLNNYELHEKLTTPVSSIKSFYMSSGSTGEPGIWPRLSQANESYSIFVNFIYELYWNISSKKTLYITALDLGIWASGNLQFHAALYCSEKNNFTFANTGADFKYIYSVIKTMHKYYDQVIISAYPSLARRLMDYLLDSKMNIKGIDIKFMLGGEPHTIEWRHYILQRLGKSKDDVKTIIDYYGTSDSGGPGLSTPISSLIQNLCVNDMDLCKSLFHQATVPSLFQQNPLLYVEEVNGKIIITYPGQLPLCRYDSGDTGGILKFSDVEKILIKSGYNLQELAAKNNINIETIWKWPFIYLTGRSDYAIMIGGAIVYPKDIEGLFFKEVTKNINSFKIGVEEDSTHSLKLVIYLELKEKNFLDKPNKKLLTQKLKSALLDRLLTVNADFAAAYEMDSESCDPKIILCDFNTPPFSEDRKKPKANFILK